MSAHQLDFMIGSAELDVDGVTADGERAPVLRNLAWQLGRAKRNGFLSSVSPSASRRSAPTPIPPHGVTSADTDP